MSERRSQPRFFDADLVMLAWNENGTTLKQLGNVEDLSLNGMALLTFHSAPHFLDVVAKHGKEILEDISSS